jgi:hypothetical protein
MYLLVVVMHSVCCIECKRYQVCVSLVGNKVIRLDLLLIVMLTAVTFVSITVLQQPGKPGSKFQQTTPSKESQNASEAQQLWELSEKIVGLA